MKNFGEGQEVTQPRPVEQRIFDGIGRRNTEKLQNLFGNVEPRIIEAESALRNSSKQWVRDIETEGPPTGFADSSWKSWSAEFRAKNFALLQEALQTLNLGPDQLATITGYILHKSYDLQTGHAEIQSIHIIPNAARGVCAIEFNYNRYNDVRQEMNKDPRTETFRIEIGEQQFTTAKRMGYAIPGITVLGIDQQQLSRSLTHDTKKPVARMSYDAKRNVVCFLATTDIREEGDPSNRLGSIPVAVTEASEFFSPGEIHLLKTATSVNVEYELLQALLHEKSTGWTLKERVSLAGTAKKDRTRAALPEIIKDIANTELAEKLTATAEADVRRSRENLIRNWQNRICKDALSGWDAERERQSKGALGIVAGIFRKEPDPGTLRKEAWRDIQAFVATLRPTTRTSTTISSIDAYTSHVTAEDDEPDRVTVSLDIQVSFSGIDASHPIPGVKKPLRFFVLQTELNGKITSSATMQA